MLADILVGDRYKGKLARSLPTRRSLPFLLSFMPGLRFDTETFTLREGTPRLLRRGLSVQGLRIENLFQGKLCVFSH